MTHITTALTSTDAPTRAAFAGSLTAMLTRFRTSERSPASRAGTAS
jgi:hypothetical protein